MELTTGIEPVTSSLPRKCSTTEPREQISLARIKWSGRRGSNSRPPAWKAGALPTELHPQNTIWYDKYCHYQYCLCNAFNGGVGWIRTIESIRCQIYSLIPLATREPLLKKMSVSKSPKFNAPIFKMELPIGFEPTTVGLQNRCSTN